MTARWLSTKETMIEFGIKQSTLYMYIKFGLPHRIKPGTVRNKEFDGNALLEWLAAHKRRCHENNVKGAMVGINRRKGLPDDAGLVLDFDKAYARSYKAKYLSGVLAGVYGESKGAKIRLQISKWTNKKKDALLARIDKDARERLEGRLYCQWIVLAGIFGVYE